MKQLATYLAALAVGFAVGISFYNINDVKDYVYGVLIIGVSLGFSGFMFGLFFGFIISDRYEWKRFNGSLQELPTGEYLFLVVIDGIASYEHLSAASTGITTGNTSRLAAAYDSDTPIQILQYKRL